MTIIIFYADGCIKASKHNEFRLVPKGFFLDGDYNEIDSVSKILVDGVCIYGEEE